MIDDLEQRQSEMRSRLAAPDREKARIYLLRWRHRNIEHVREQDRASAIRTRLKREIQKVARAIYVGLQSGCFRELTAIEKIQLRVAAARKERERRETPISVDVAASLFDMTAKQFVSLMVYPGVHGNLRVVSEAGAPRLFRTADVEDLWEKISETRPDFFHDMRHRKKPNPKTRARKEIRFSGSLE